MENARSHAGVCAERGSDSVVIVNEYLREDKTANKIARGLYFSIENYGEYAGGMVNSIEMFLV